MNIRSFKDVRGNSSRSGFRTGGSRGRSHSPSRRHATANQPASLKLANPNEGPSRNSFAPIVKKVLPEVVNISSTKVVKTAVFRDRCPRDADGPILPAVLRR